jgi:hypothetical protein
MLRDRGKEIYELVKSQAPNGVKVVMELIDMEQGLGMTLFKGDKRCFHYLLTAASMPTECIVREFVEFMLKAEEKEASD